MKTILIKRSRKASRVSGAVALMVAAAILYTVTAFCRPQNRAVVDASSENRERITQEYTLAAQQLHLLCLGSYEQRDEARVEAARYVSRGTAGYLYQAERLYVAAAGYFSREEAEIVASQLKSNEGLSSQIITLESQPLSLKITAAQEQIQTLVSCDATLRQVLNELQRLSFILDTGETDYLQVVQELEKCAEQAAFAARQLQGDYELTGSAVGSGYMQLLNQYSSSLQQILHDSAVTMLGFSSRLKYALIDNMLAHIRFLNGLTENNRILT